MSWAFLMLPPSALSHPSTYPSHFDSNWVEVTQMWGVLKPVCCPITSTSYIPSSFFFFPGSRDNGILSRLSPTIPLFTTQSTYPFQSEGTCKETLRLLVNVESLVETVVVCEWLLWRSEVKRSHWMVGGGLPVAEQEKVTSAPFSLALMSTAVVTSDIPG